jgi:virginiamycin B lyase
MSKKRHMILPSIASIIAVISIAKLLSLPLLLPVQQLSLHAEVNNSSSNHMLQEFLLPTGSHPHDVAPSADGRTIWYTAQVLGQLGQLDPKTGKTHSIALGKGHLQ